MKTLVTTIFLLLPAFALLGQVPAGISHQAVIRNASGELVISQTVSGSNPVWGTGIRKDPWEEKHRIVVEEHKKPELRGYYIHPQPYGQPETLSTEWARNPELMKMMTGNTARDPE